MRLLDTVEHVSCLLLGHTHAFILAQIARVLTQFRSLSAGSQGTLIVDLVFMLSLNEHLLQV